MAKILLADDEADTISLFKDALEEEGYTIVTARDGLDVLRLIQAEMPDLLILDLRIPGLDGERILSRLTRDKLAPAIKVFVLTGFNDFNVTKERIKNKFGGLVAEYFEKPADLIALCSAVATHLPKGEKK